MDSILIGTQGLALFPNESAVLNLCKNLQATFVFFCATSVEQIHFC